MQAIIWKDDHLLLLDQRQLPHKELWLEMRTCSDVADAIADMIVRGAPAIAISAAYGLVLAYKIKKTEKMQKKNYYIHVQQP